MKDFFTMPGKKRRKRNNGKKVAAGVGAGLIAGAAAGILLAPKSGKETRQDIKEAAGTAVEATKKTVNKAVNSIKKKKDEEDCCCEEECTETAEAETVAEEVIENFDSETVE